MNRMRAGIIIASVAAALAFNLAPASSAKKIELAEPKPISVEFKVDYGIWRNTANLLVNGNTVSSTKFRRGRADRVDVSIKTKTSTYRWEIL